MIVQEHKHVTKYTALFHIEHHPEIFEQPMYKRLEMCKKLFEAEYDLVKPAYGSEMLSARVIEFTVYSLHSDL